MSDCIQSSWANPKSIQHAVLTPYSGNLWIKVPCSAHVAFINLVLNLGYKKEMGFFFFCQELFSITLLTVIHFVPVLLKLRSGLLHFSLTLSRADVCLSSQPKSSFPPYSDILLEILIFCGFFSTFQKRWKRSPWALGNRRTL